MMTPTITKLDTKWLVEGEILAYSNGGRTLGPEEYWAAFRTRKAAEIDVMKLERFNIYTAERHAEEAAYRAAKVDGYLAVRAARKAATPVQLSLAF